MGLGLSGPVEIVTCHAAGEVGDVIVAGVQNPPGATLWEQARWIHNDGQLRDFVLNEPRGGVFRHVNLLVPPIHPDAQLGFIIMEPAHTPPMSGSNSMCVATVALETGIVEMTEPVTRLVMEAPGGLVEVEADCHQGKVERVRVRNVASFADRIDAVIDVDGIGEVRVDTAFGGDSFVFVEAGDVGMEISPANARDLAAVGTAVARAATDQLRFDHPDLDGWNHISFAAISSPLERSGSVVTVTNAVAIEPGKIDRSPTGTGVSARLALLAARGVIEEGDKLITRSIIGSEFEGEIAGTTRVGDRDAVVPIVSGRAWITGSSRLILDESDPWARGYRLSDTWPGG